MSIIRYFKLWNMWRKKFGGSWVKQLVVLSGVKTTFAFEAMKRADRFKRPLAKLNTESR